MRRPSNRTEHIAAADVPTRREVALATAALVVAIGIVLHKQVVDWYGVSDFGDPLFSMWRIAWVAHQILNDPRHLFDTNIFHPERGTLTYSDSMLLPAFVSAPFLWMGMPVAVAYTFLFLLAFLLSGVATYLLARALSLPPGPAWIAAFMFAVCPYRFEHYSHLELQLTWWMPLALLAALRLLGTGRPWFFVYLMLALAGQWYSSMYYGVFLTIFTGAFVAVLGALQRPGWRRFAAALAALATGVAAALPLAGAYQSTAVDRGIRSKGEVQHYSAVPMEYLQPNPLSVYREFQVVRKRNGERQLFPHATPLVLAAAGLVPPLGATHAALLGAGLVAFDGSLGFNGLWYEFAYDNLEPLRSMRVPARFAILVNLVIALFAGFGATRLTALLPRNRRRLLISAFAVAAVVESIPYYAQLRPVWRRPPLLYSSLGPASGAVLFEAPIMWGTLEENFAYLYFSTWHWTPTVNGYSGYFPRSFWELLRETDGFPLGNSVDYLESRRVTHVTVHCALWADEPCALTVGRIGADPRLRLMQTTWWEGKPAYLYELVRASPKPQRGEGGP